MSDKNKLELVVSEQGGKAAFRKPPPKTILKEEEYVSKIEDIVERDFFPDLERLRLRKEYQEAVDGGDLNRVGEIQERWGKLIAKEEAEAAGAGGGNAAITAAVNSEKIERLDDFLNRHTSEDNASFLEIVEDTRAQNRKKYWWLYEPQLPAITAGENKDELNTNKSETDLRQSLMISNANEFNQRNALMFEPDAAALTEIELSEIIQSKPIIQHANTRIHQDHTKGIEILSNAIRLSRTKTQSGKVGVDGKTHDLQNEGNYSLMTTPSPAPGVGESPMMTWGEIGATPLQIDTPGPAFKMPETPARDELLMKLDNENIKKRKKATNVTQPKKSRDRRTPMTPSQRLKYLSPAAQLLACKTGLATPSPLHSGQTPGLTPSSRTPGSTRSSNTPLSKTPRSRRSESHDQSSITDNLLKLSEK